MLPKKVEKIRKEMQETITLSNEAVALWRSEDPTREYLLPSKWELTSFLMRRLRKTVLALRIAIQSLESREVNPAVVRRLRRAL